MVEDIDYITEIMSFVLDNLQVVREYMPGCFKKYVFQELFMISFTGSVNVTCSTLQENWDKEFEFI